MDDLDNNEQNSHLGGESVKVINNPSEGSYGGSSASHGGASSGSSYGGNSSSSSYGNSSPQRSNSGIDTTAQRPQSNAGGIPAFRHSPANQQDTSRGSRIGGGETKSTNFTGGSPSVDRMKDSRRILTVGSDILLKGEIATCDRLIIEGKVDAVLNDVGTIELSENGSFKGIAQVENAEISGLFDGELIVKGRLVVYASGRVRGKVTYGEVEIERGGELTGEIKTMSGANGSRKTAAEKTKEDKVAVA